MRQQKPTAQGTIVRAKLTAILAKMDWEEVYDLVEQMIPHGCASKPNPTTPISVTGPTLVVAKQLGVLLKQYDVEEILSPEMGFLAGPARSEFLTWYVERVLSPSRRGFYSLELAKLQGLQQLRRIMQQANLI